jgi:L-amino acid N-acyltransferase YncA
MAFTIRAATPADLPGILAIYNDAVLRTTASYDYEPSTLEARTAWYEAHVQERLPIFVAEDGDSIVGWSALHSFRPKIGYRYTVENSVYVAAERRRQGIGRALLVPLIQRARARDARADCGNRYGEYRQHPAACRAGLRAGGAYQGSWLQVRSLARPHLYAALVEFERIVKRIEDKRQIEDRGSRIEDRFNSTFYLLSSILYTRIHTPQDAGYASPRRCR